MKKDRLKQTGRDSLTERSRQTHVKKMKEEYEQTYRDWE